MKMIADHSESIQEKWANKLTHGVGVLLSISTLIYFLWCLNEWSGGGLKVGIVVFASALIFVYLSSTLYHLADVYFKNWSLFFRKLDHISIYTLIAGTQTPFIFLYLNNSKGITYLIILWSLVLLGVLFKLFLLGKYKKLSVSTYLGLGWLVLFVMPLMYSQMVGPVFNWVLIGGIAYSSGVIFYLWNKLKYNHAIWHLFVLTGSISHFIALSYALSNS